jgi:hypothetical protein
LILWFFRFAKKQSKSAAYWAMELKAILFKELLMKYIDYYGEPLKTHSSRLARR